MTKQDLNAYAMKVTQCNRTQLVTITLEVADAYICEAMKLYEAGDKKLFRENINKARSFINELTSSLDFKYEISQSLFAIYRYMNKALVKADISFSDSELSGISGMLKKLMHAFTEVAKTDRSGPVMGNTQQVYAGLTYSRNSLNENLVQGYENNRGYKA